LAFATRPKGDDQEPRSKGVEDADTADRQVRRTRNRLAGIFGFLTENCGGLEAEVAVAAKSTDNPTEPLVEACQGASGRPSDRRRRTPRGRKSTRLRISPAMAMDSTLADRSMRKYPKVAVSARQINAYTW
jgi:hypothetical protein